MATVLLDGLGIPESTRWHDGRLWFCNWTTQQIVAVDGAGTPEIVATVDTRLPYSIDWLPDGRLLVVSGREARLLVRSADGFHDYADLSAYGSTFNELVVAASGDAYVNFDGIVLVRADGSVQQVADGLQWGNGMAVTADGSTLIVAESHAGRLTAFTIERDGALSDRRVWADLDGDAPDGICLDAEGAVWYASVPGQHCVRVQEGGRVLQTVPIDRGAFTCMLGGVDGTSLFIGAAEWHGMDAIADGVHTGQVLVEAVDVPHAGHP